jgi:uncharacterized protein YyaL (SSP411 family)
MNKLSGEKSAYLKHAADQKIDWYPWSEEAFARARDEDKPLFLSTGAVWCHWCHVMASESFYDDETADLLNKYFISVKLDRDERPSIDRRYQMAVSAMGSSGGWPLSVFLTPDKKPFYGGNYFPPEDRLGRPGFKKVLRAISEMYQTKKHEISEYTNKVMKALTSPSIHGEEVNESQLTHAVQKIINAFEPQNGGFGSAPKFPMPGVVEFMINRYLLTGNKSIGKCLRKTMEAMANGGMHDHIGGGFHRYSTDDSWIIPHFEKMADDNAWLLRNYLGAYSVFGDRLFREVAEGIVRFVFEVLSDREGGFYNSQDADITPDDEGGYFTWTDEDFRKVLNDEEYRILSSHFISEAGSMHHDGSKKVLIHAANPEEIAAKTGLDKTDVVQIIKKGKNKLAKARNKRTKPFVDETIYTSTNGMFISAFLLGYRILRDEGLKDFAMKSLEMVLNKYLTGDELYHTEGIKALLDDYIYLIEALISAYEATGNSSHLSRADGLMEMCIQKFWDGAEGGFHDTDAPMLGVKIKGMQDIPHPSTNSLGIILLIKLHVMTGKNKYYQFAKQALSLFSLTADELGVHAGYYYSAVDAFFNSLKLDVYVKPESELAKSAVSMYIPYANILYGEDKGYIIPCKHNVCYDRIDSREGLIDFVQGKKYFSNS